MKVVVVGAGIGGLVAARALGARGHEVTLLERAPAFRAVGAGIVLGANAVAVLGALGVDPRPVGQRLTRMDITDHRGAVVGPLPIEGDGVTDQVWAFHRAELHEVLARALPPTVRVRLGAALEDLEVGEDGVTLRAGGEALRADVVVGADGLHSRVRAAVAPAAQVRYSGQTCWRTVVDVEVGTGAVEAWGEGGTRFGVVPLKGGRAYLFLVAPAALGAPTPEWTAFAETFGTYGGLPARAWPAVRPESLMHHDLEELPAPAWGTPRAWLLGDAAHAMTPNLGQGAAMAIEDAGALALAFGEDLPASHAAWVALRDGRVREIVGASARVGRVAAWSHPVLRWVRNTALHLTPPSVASAQLQGRVFGPGLRLAERIAGA